MQNVDNMATGINLLIGVTTRLDPTVTHPIAQRDHSMLGVAAP